MSEDPTFEDEHGGGRSAARTAVRLTPVVPWPTITMAAREQWTCPHAPAAPRRFHHVSRCASCNTGTVKRGTTTATFETEGTTVVVRNVPADVCDTCGEGYYDVLTTERLLALAAEAAEWSAAPVQICDYTAD